MDPSVELLIAVIALVLAIVCLMAQLRLFSIDRTLKGILKRMEAGGSTPAQPEPETTAGELDVSKTQAAMWDR
jgi:hypothetical protein